MFIIVEGPDWVGKTTITKGIKESLKDSFIPKVTTTREPGGTDLGNKIREILFDIDQDIDPLAETLLFLADRAQHIKKVIEKTPKDHLIISDRYDLTTIVYQCKIKKAIDKHVLVKIEKMLGFPQPDAAIILTAEEPLSSSVDEDTFMKKFDFSFKELNEIYRNKIPYSYPKLFINSSKTSIESSVNTSVDFIKRLFNKKNISI